MAPAGRWAHWRDGAAGEHTGDVSRPRAYVLKMPDQGLPVAIPSDGWEREPAPATPARRIAHIVVGQR